MHKLFAMLPICLFLSPSRAEVTAVSAAIAPMAAVQDQLPAGDPVTFLEKCLERYHQQGIGGYTLLMHKQERIGQKLQPSEDIQIFYRENPHSVLMKWLAGQRRAASALYVQGENDGKMLVHPAGLAGRLAPVVSRDVDGEDAKQAGRYPITEVGLKETLSRTLRDWKAAKEQGTLQVQYLGIRSVREGGDRECYALQRTCAPGENAGVLEVTAYIDKETLLPVRTVLKGEENRLIGDYIFRDVRLNPQFRANQFQRSALTQ